ncbi:hypothetical protein [Cellulosilyticum lentocellum]|uniref:PIN domain-containing protein n=1 Tax=Cellulosilyticum lentocellum (strain ATCC 49066 / DSM 5427 / NCIMB 11756 / RHM5) TaxID=642492 RepID=F2JGG1_CELLD|nr:hypothetical protein [Cellulosilyticum lentocellum]ADZ82916.1 hypothetical protein Clole_1187 [Cellulosilyticum lentocellum DSM 5427]
MINIKGKEYKLAFVDTCILSQMVRDDKFCLEVLNKSVEEKWIFCVSMYNLVELKQCNNDEKLNRFIEIFDNIPNVFIIKSHVAVIKEEVDSYIKGFKQEQILQVKIGSTSSVKLKEVLFEFKEFNDFEKEFMSTREDTLNIIQTNLKDSKYNPTNPTEIKNFVINGTLTQLSLRHPTFLKNRISFIKKHNLITKERIEDKFPSLKLMHYIMYYKFLTNRNMELSDVGDLVMVAPIPYMDIVLIEKQQAEFLRQIGSKMKEIKKLEIYKMNDKNLIKVQ